MVRGWLVLQRSGLSESSKKTVLGSAEHTLGRSRIVEAPKQQWSDHELLVYDGDRKRDRDRKMRAHVQGETNEWDGAGSWEAEDDQFDGSSKMKKHAIWQASIRRSPCVREKREKQSCTIESNHA